MGLPRTSSLHWAAGGLLALFGSLVLVAPHQFATPAYASFQPQLVLWGLSFLAVGAGLLATVALGLPRPVAITARVAAGCVLLLLASGFWRTGGWTGIVVYGMLGLGCFWAAALPERVQGPPGPDLFALVIALTSVCNGIVILAIPSQFTGVFYDVMRPVLRWNGAALLIGGAALLAVSLHTRASRRAVWLGHLLAAGGLWFFLATNSLPLWLLTGIVYYGGMGAMIAALPWLGSRLETIEPNQLRIRLALSLAASAVLPLLLTLTLLTQQQENLALERALLAQESVASILAEDLSSYLALHEGAVVALGSQPDLAALPAAAYRDRLTTVQRAFPDFSVLQSFDADGRAIARSDENPLSRPVGENSLFTEPRRTGQAAITLTVGAVLQRPLLVLSAPVFDEQGDFAGLIAGAIDSERLATTLARAARWAESSVYLVDEQGRLLAQPGVPRERIFEDRRAVPAVSALRASPEASGALHYRDQSRDALAGYARLSRLGWGIVVEQPARAVLSDVYAGRDLIFLGLIAMLAAALAVGFGIAFQLTRPLSALAVAAEQFADQGARDPLPASGVSEVAHLTAIFATMRERLAARTAERDLLYAAEQEARLSAEQAVTMRDLFLSVAAHELRNPLTSLLGNAQLVQRRLQADGKLSERDERGLNGIITQSQRLNRLIGGLFDISRLEQGQLQIERAPLDLDALAQGAVAELQPTLHIHSISYSGPQELMLVLGDATRLEQVLLNLLQNAVRYSPAGGAVEVRLEQRGDYAMLTVSDRGIGIPASDLPRLFQRFARAENAAAYKIAGTGLGLYVVGEIVRLHGGSVTVESVEGEGSSFAVLLPLMPAQLGPDEQLPVENAASDLL